MGGLGDFVKTTSPTAPPSLGAVRSQSRYYGMGLGSGSGGSGVNEPGMRADMGRFQEKETSNLARLQQRASEIQVAAQQDALGVEAARGDDLSKLNREAMERNEGDVLDTASRGVAAFSAIGNAIHGISKRVGLDNVATFLEKMPLIGPSKESKKLQDLYDQVLDAGEKQDKNKLQELLAQVKMHGNRVNEQNAYKGVLSNYVTPEEIDAAFINSRVIVNFNDSLNRYIDALGDSGVYVTTGKDDKVQDRTYTGVNSWTGSMSY